MPRIINRVFKRRTDDPSNIETARWNSEQQQQQQRQLAEEASAAEAQRIAEIEERRILEELERDKVLRVVEQRQREEDKSRVARERRQQAASRQTIRQLRHLIRERHRLDHYVWNKRRVLRADRHIIMQDCQRADNLLHQIYEIVNTWERDQFQDQEEWLVAKRIKDNIIKQRDRNQHPSWVGVPPWERDENGESRTFDPNPY